MRRHEANEGIPALDVALSEFVNAEDLKMPSALAEEKITGAAEPDRVL